MAALVELGDALSPIRRAVRKGDFERIATLCAAVIRRDRQLGMRVADHLLAVFTSNHPAFLEDRMQLNRWVLSGLARWQGVFATHATSADRLRATVDAALIDLRATRPPEA